MKKLTLYIVSLYFAFVLLLFIILMGCSDSRRVPYRVKDCLNKSIEVVKLDSAYRANDTVALYSYPYKYVVLERVK